ncbi:hypothetical protein QZH41_007755 [Actinostola sp. cb2023]|nr:hypothetical protein QZH41_007755 [Actinostola sp. cb2023]
MVLIASCAIAWLIALIDGCMYVQFKTLLTFGDTEYCIEDWPDSQTMTLFIYANSSLIGILPLITITVLNILCIYRLCQTKSRAAQRRHSKSTSFTRFATKKIITIALIFVACRAPIHIFELLAISTIDHNDIGIKGFLVISTLCYGLYFFSSATHPVFFGLMSVYYREAFKRNCPCVRAVPRRRKNSKPTQSSKIQETAFNSNVFLGLPVVERGLGAKIKHRHQSSSSFFTTVIMVNILTDNHCE